ncbi:putative major facilitator superfamily domain-containing protein 6 [Apostichopus japonicus]|uniref:Putative major facilitator superfamily domain-containing protein 6 n=1 Tax=Stichopus japonicus TaxID=307972 RepID=A0A2G8K0M9_STIJA|nr:putative major facilitator superfamily domain-containing protein 6 [Apostichopus japonicus]
MPWLVIPFELLHGITYGASWAGCSFYANHIAPSGLANSLLKIFTALYMGLGKGLGALIGGFIYEYLGAKLLFRFAALVSRGACFTS